MLEATFFLELVLILMLLREMCYVETASLSDHGNAIASIQGDNVIHIGAQECVSEINKTSKTKFHGPVSVRPSGGLRRNVAKMMWFCDERKRIQALPSGSRNRTRSRIFSVPHETPDAASVFLCTGDQGQGIARHRSEARRDTSGTRSRQTMRCNRRYSSWRD